MANSRKRKATTKKATGLQHIAKKKRAAKSSTKKQNKSSIEVPTTTTIATVQQPLSSLVHDASWSKNLQDLFNDANFKSIEQYLNNQWSTGKITYPPNNLIFEAFNKTPFDQVKVVLLGQDPYHDDGQVKAKFFSENKIIFITIFLGSWISLFCTENNDNIATIFKKHF
jgi:hypothetical protein